jgi:hypothetical protein
VKARFFYGPSRLGCGPAFFFGAFVLVWWTHVAIELWKQGELSFLLLLLLFLLAGFVIRNGYDFFNQYTVRQPLAGRTRK